MKQPTKSPPFDFAEKARINNKLKKPRQEDELRRTLLLERELDILQSVMDGAVNSHLVYLDRNFNLIRVNETYARTCGYRPEDMIGKNHFALYPHAENEAIFTRVRDTGEPVEIHDKPFVYPDQPERGVTYWDWTLTPVKRGGQVEGLVLSLHETTDRKRAEKALQENEERLRVALSSAKFGTFDFNPLTGEISWDDSMKQIWGIPVEEQFDYARALERIHPDDREMVNKTLANSMKPDSDGDYTCEYRMLLPDGSIHWTVGKGRVHFEGHGDQRHAVRIIGVQLDITDRKQAEEALLRNEERLRVFFESEMRGAFYWNMDGRITAANDKLLQMVGYSREELTKGIVNWKKMTPPEYWDMDEYALSELRKKGVDTPYEKEYIRKDGTRLPILTGAAMINENEGVCFVLDISERKRAEEALRKANDELEDKVQERTYQLSEAIKTITRSEEKYRELVERAQSIILRLDYDGNVTFFNEFAEKFFGYPQQEILGRNVIGTIVPEKESSGRDLKLLIKDLAVHPERHINNENENMRKNGERVWIAWTNAPVYDTRGKLKEILCVGNDITERRKMEQRLRSAQKNLRAMAAEIVIADERSRQHFAADLHDTVIQTIGAAKIRSHLIEGDIPEKVSTEYRELQDLISQSITQARFIMAELSPPVLNELGFIPAMEWLTEQITNQHGIEIEFNSADGFMPLQHEIQVLLFQGTRELLMNVVKHAEAGKAHVKVSRSKKKIRIEIMDDGKGFNKRQAFRTDVSSGGFGLYSIRERIRHFGGQLIIQSEEGKGTRVVMTAPTSRGGGDERRKDQVKIDKTTMHQKIS